MALNCKKLISFSAVCIGTLAGGLITSCGKSIHGHAQQVISSQMVASLQDSTIADGSLPAPESVPQLKYTSIKSIFGDSREITEGTNIKEIFLKLRAISSLTKAYHQELVDLINETSSLDFPHLMLVADASYFPVVVYNNMLSAMGDPRVCGQMSPALCQSKMAKIQSNSQSAQVYGIFVNTILLNGWPKLDHVTSDQAYLLLKKSYPQLDSTNLLFKNIVSALTDLTADEKLLFMNLAVEKSALGSAVTLALDWYKTDSDKTFESLMTLAGKIPLSDSRDEFLLNAIGVLSSVTGEQAKELVALTVNPLQVAKVALEKVNALTAHDLVAITSLCKNSLDKEALVSLGISTFKIISSAEAVDIIRQTDKNKVQVAQNLIALIPHFSAADLIFIAQNALFGQDREDLIIANINRFSVLTAVEVRSIADQVGRNRSRIILSMLPKVSKLSGLELTHIVEALSFGPERDEALLAGIKLVEVSSIDADVAGLNLAYNAKIDVTIALLEKTVPLAATDLAFIVKNCLNATTRDQILLKGSSFVSQASVDGVIAMLAQADQEKVGITVALLPKIKDVNGHDFGLILKSINDGVTRDRVIASALSLVKKVDGDGAALIVDRSFDSKAETAAKLLTMIPGASGTDLNKILAVCGSGNTRDIILVNGIKLLEQLTPFEAKSLYSRAYSNKDVVAVSLISKVNNIDGKTIGEMALFSAKGSVRDLIITEGLKRLKVVDVDGLIAMVTAADKLTEKLVLETSSRIENFSDDNAIDIANAISLVDLRDRFLLRAIDLIIDLDEPSITRLALAASNQDMRMEIVHKGIEKMGDDL